MSTPTYDDGTAAYNTAQTVNQEKESGVIDYQYVKGIPGLLKLLEAVFSLIAFICVQAGAICVGSVAANGFFSFVAMTAFTMTIILYVVLLLKLQRRIFRCDCINWPLTLLCYYAGFCVFYFFGFLFLALQGCATGQKAGAAFGFFALATFGVDLFFAVRTFIQSRGEARSSQSGGGGTTNVEEGPRY